MALGRADGTTVVSTVDSENMRQSVQLPVATEKFLDDNGLTFRDIGAIGVVVGPGSFTGIRVGIAYAKGLAIGLDIPVIPINAFEVYLAANPDAFVAIDSHRGDFFVAAADLNPCMMAIDTIETDQMKYAKTVGHNPFDMADALSVVNNKLSQIAKGAAPESAIPLYMRPHYAEKD